MATNGGIAQSAFKDCTTLSTIEFDFTTPTGKNLSDFNTGDGGQAAVTALTNIYKMFAAEGNDFGDSTQIGTSENTISANKAWLPTTNASTNPTFVDADKTLFTNFNGIKWSAKVAKPEGNGNAFTSNTDVATKLQNATQLEITGTLPAEATGQSFKYKYTNNDGTSVSTSAQPLPSNVTTIKIVLKNAGSK